MARKYHLVVMHDSDLETYKKRLYQEIAAVTAEISIREALAERTPTQPSPQEERLYDIVQLLFTDEAE